MTKAFPIVPLGKAITHRSEFIEIGDTVTYMRCRVQLHAQGIVLRDKVNGVEIKTKKQQVCRAGEFLVAEIDAKVGGFGVVPSELEGAIVSSHYFLFEVNDKVLDRRFLDYYIRTPFFREQVTSRGSTNYAAIRPHHVLEYTTPLPPLSEQKRIVARIEELAGKIEEARGLRTLTQDELRLLLQGAKRHVIGDLTENSHSWPVVPLGDISQISYGVSAAISDLTDSRFGIPIIRMANVSLDGTLDVSDLRYYPLPEADKQQFLLRKGDLMLNWRSGSEKHVGKTALFDLDGEYTHASFLLRIRSNSQLANARYLKALLNYMRAEGAFLDNQRFQVNTKLNATEFSRIPMFLPPLAEQRRIVAYLDDLQCKVDGLRKLQAETSAELDALLPSILDKAFKGDL